MGQGLCEAGVAENGRQIEIASAFWHFAGGSQITRAGRRRIGRLVLYLVVPQQVGVWSPDGMGVALEGCRQQLLMSNTSLIWGMVMTPKNATAVTRSVQFGGEDWEVSDRALASDTVGRSSNLIAFQSAAGFVLHRYALSPLTSLSDLDLRDLLLLALLAHS